LNKTDEPDYYELLNIAPDAGLNDIIQAYYEVCKKYSIFPDGDEINHDNEFNLYHKAYKILSTPESKKEYDSRLKNDIPDLQKNTNPMAIKQDIIPIKLKKENDTPINNKVKTGELNISQFKSEMTNEMFDKAKHYLEKGEYHEAINLFRKLIELKNDEPKYHTYLGLSLMKKGWDTYAQAEFKIALEYDPNDTIATIFYKRKDHPTKTLESKATSKLNVKETTQLSPDQEKSAGKKGWFYKIISFFNKNNPE
jgi:tetratricopeptide (TPR) repeat protein